MISKASSSKYSSYERNVRHDDGRSDGAWLEPEPYDGPFFTQELRLRSEWSDESAQAVVNEQMMWSDTRRARELRAQPYVVFANKVDWTWP